MELQLTVNQRISAVIEAAGRIEARGEWPTSERLQNELDWGQSQVRVYREMARRGGRWKWGDSIGGKPPGRKQSVRIDAEMILTIAKKIDARGGWPTVTSIAVELRVAPDTARPFVESAREDYPGEWTWEGRRRPGTSKSATGRRRRAAGETNPVGRPPGGRNYHRLPTEEWQRRRIELIEAAGRIAARGEWPTTDRLIRESGFTESVVTQVRQSIIRRDPDSWPWVSAAVAHRVAEVKATLERARAELQEEVDRSVRLDVLRNSPRPKETPADVARKALDEWKRIRRSTHENDPQPLRFQRSMERTL
jgi:hypothetical protein